MTPTLYLRLAVMVFLHYFVWSCWYNTMAVYLGKLNFTGTQIGLAYGTTAIGALISPFLIGVIADRYVPAQRLLGVLHLLGAGLLWWISQQTQQHDTSSRLSCVHNGGAPGSDTRHSTHPRPPCAQERQGLAVLAFNFILKVCGFTCVRALLPVPHRDGSPTPPGADYEVPLG